MNHPPYSPDLAPCDFHLFPKLKYKLKGQSFEDISTIQSAVVEEMRQLPEITFQKCMGSLKKRWRHCVDSEGMYFEGDKFD
jgi:hypothetical protein